MKKILYITLLLSLFCFPIIILANEDLEDQEETSNNTTNIMTGQQEIDGNKYYYNDEGTMQTGFVTLDGKIFFYSRLNGALKTGWQGSTEGQWYQNEDGEVVTGKQEIDGNKYFFNDQGILQKGFVTIDDKIYFYSRITGALKTGWQGSTEGQWYQKEDGEVVTGRQEIDGRIYYFNNQGMMQKGFVTIDDRIYFYSRATGTLKTGWQGSTEGQWYQKEDGEVVTGRQEIDENKYYFNEQGMMQKGFVTIDNKIYFYSRVNGRLKKGIQGADNVTWYQKEDGEVVVAEGVLEVEGKEYFFEGRNLKNGIIEIDGKKYYFDKKTYAKQNKTVKTKYYELVIDDETGEFLKKQYHPVYYMQKDSRWNNKKYGSRTFGMTGCAPTGMAMAYTSILQREVLPTEVGNYLYYNTDQYNRHLPGTSGMGIIYASNHFNVKWTGIGTKEDMIEALKEGKIIYASMQNGKFAKPTYNHVIIMYDYNESTNKTYTLDPLTTLNNGWNDVDLIWREQCMDPDDRTGGYAFYSLEEK